MTQRILFGITVLSLLLLVVSIETEAKVLSKHNKRGVTVRSVNNDTLLRTNDAKERHNNRRASPKQKLRTLLKLSKACNCNCTTLQDEWGGFGSCFGSCLQSWGVSSSRITACMGLCVAASTGNPFGIVACVTCLGVTQWTVEWCALKCAWGHAVAMESGVEAKTRLQRRNNKRAPAPLRV